MIVDMKKYRILSENGKEPLRVLAECKGKWSKDQLIIASH